MREIDKREGPSGIGATGMPAGEETDESRGSLSRRMKRDRSSLQEGLLIMNQTLERVALDRGAVAILNLSGPPGPRTDPASFVPKPVLDLIRRNVHDMLQVTMYFPIDEQTYVWRAYWFEAQNGFIREPMVGLHVERVVADRDPIVEVANRYKLTERERETLCGISMGLASQELAKLMGISPNTVKAFVRMIMIKMGVTTRAGIVANLLQSVPTRDLRAR